MGEGLNRLLSLASKDVVVKCKPKQEKFVLKNGVSDEILLSLIHETKERQAGNAEQNRPQHKPKPPKERIYRHSQDALERMDQRFYDKAREREGTLTPRQTQILTAYSNGFTTGCIALKYGIGRNSVVTYLKYARNRLDALSNPHAVKIAVQKGLIK